MAPIDWALVVLTGIVGVLGLFCMFDGARRIALYGSNSASRYLIGLGAAICLMLAGYAYWKYREQQVEAHFVEFVMWLVWGAAALVFGALFAREPKAEPVEENTKIEPVLAPPVAARAPQPAPAAAPAKPAAAAATTPAAPPLRPAAPPKPAVGFNTMPLAKTVGGDTVPLPKPVVGADTVPLPKHAVGSDTVPLPKPGIPSVTIPLAKPPVGEDTVPLAKPAPGTLTPPSKKE